MSTNFYFKVKGIDQIVEQFKSLSSLITDEMVYEVMKKLGIIHISQTAGQWKPLFESQKYFKTMKELELFFLTHQGQLIIENEYGVEYKWEEFKDYMTKDNKEGKTRIGIEKDCIIDLSEKMYIDEEGFEWMIGEFC